MTRISKQSILLVVVCLGNTRYTQFVAVPDEHEEEAHPALNAAAGNNFLFLH